MLRPQLNFLFSQHLEGRWLASFYFPSFCSLVRPPALTMETWRIVQVASPRTEKTKVETSQSSRLEVRFPTPFFSGQPCVFPFSDESGSLHYTCTANGDAYGEEWCATQTDLEHSVLEWGHCSPGCQELPPQQRQLPTTTSFLAGESMCRIILQTLQTGVVKQFSL